MHPLKAFIVLPMYYSSLIKCMVDLKWIDTKKYYKVFYITSGTITINLSRRQIQVKAGGIFFQRPGEYISCGVSQEAEGYFCLIHPEYLRHGTTHVIDMFQFFPFYTSVSTGIKLTDQQSDIISICFEMMIREEWGRHPDKKQAIVLHLQMIMLQSKRAGSNSSDVSDAGNIDQLFYLTRHTFSLS